MLERIQEELSVEARMVSILKDISETLESLVSEVVALRRDAESQKRDWPPKPHLPGNVWVQPVKTIEYPESLRDNVEWLVRHTTTTNTSEPHVGNSTVARLGDLRLEKRTGGSLG